MNKIAIITDSTCNIPTDMVKKYDIYVVLQHLIWGTEDLLDLKDITPSKFYERLVSDPVHPKTSQPPAVEFTKQIEAAIKDGAKEILIVTLSKELSGTHASAVTAAEAETGAKVRVYDSKSVAMGLGWQVIAAARAREAGGDLDAMESAADKVREHTSVMLTLDTLEFLHKGGRIGGASRLLGSALDVKPRLVVDAKTGKVVAGERTRTRKKAVEATYKAFFEELKSDKLHIGVHHANAAQDCEALVARIKSEHPNAEVVMSELTPVLGTHGGPGTLALCGYYEN